jgi:ATP-dependent RNA helicase SUPV3L1/SUV3
LSGSKSQRARLARIKDISREEGRELSHREVRNLMRSLSGQEITPALVAEEMSKRRTIENVSARTKKAFELFTEMAKGEYRIAGSMWEARIQINIAKTGMRFWLEIDEVRQADRDLLAMEVPEEAGLRAMAQRLRSASRLSAEPIRGRCIELDMDAMLSATDEDLVFVKTAMRQMDMRTTVPSAIIATIETVHAKALARSVALARMSANPHDIGTIVALDETVPARRIIALLGPTNSGKTHSGLEMMAEAASGSYLGPLRLMAMEQYDRMRARGLSVSMRTGEESISAEGETHLSATIEMADVDTHYSVVVVDEAQLLDDPQRGWAWTRAIFHSRCDVLVVTGSIDCLPILERIADLTGETIEVRRFERRAPLTAMTHAIETTELRAGDAVIAFSRTNVLAMKSEISKLINPSTGHPFRVATIYGALGPEVRRTEARRFSTGEAEILIATDAIGMGLNLPIDRVVFSALVKYDGRIVRDLEESEIRQIGGRAGRMGQQGGYVGMLTGAGPSIAPIGRALSRQPGPCSDPRPFIWPSIKQIREGMEVLEIDVLSRALPAVSAHLRNGPDYRCQIDPDTIDLLQTIEQFDLSLEDKHAWIGCPLTLRDQENRRLIEEWARLQQLGLAIRSPRLTYEGGIEIDDHRLKDIERTVVQAGAYLWLSRRWPWIFEDSQIAFEARRDGNRMIEDALRQRHIHRNCIECGTAIGYRVRHDTCRRCAFGD